MSPLLSVASVPYRAGHICRHFLRREVWRRFHDAAQAYGVPVWVIAWRALRWYAADRFLPNEALSRGLLDPKERIHSAGDHISEERLHGLQHAVNTPAAAMCRDKLLFHQYCSSHGLPVPRLLAVLSRCGSRDALGHPLVTRQHWQAFVSQHLPGSFVAKPRHGRQGRDIRLLGVEHEACADRPVEQLVRALCEFANSHEEQILEERLMAHQRIVALTGTPALSTVRVFSWVTPKGKPEILDAYFRGIVGNSLTDNISDCRTGLFTANVTARPDLRSGVLSQAWAFNANGVGYRWVDHHPGTDMPIKGFQLPWWEEVRALVSRAALCFLPVRTIGWDVALTPKGAFLIEANERFQHAGFGEGVHRIRSALQQEQERLRGPASPLPAEPPHGK
ncbi:sugar-transfer associated ATP-grasp domain-containing protein [Alkalispirillum mobile]|nr:sugar-transfer associated ATP-grasp domain-containing protein [Alkalispirillum mobile]